MLHNIILAWWQRDSRHLYIYTPAAGEGTLKPVTGGEWQVEEVVAVDEETLGKSW